ncbi:Hypothetical predicted protein, partial [Pelobates cultripes]
GQPMVPQETLIVVMAHLRQKGIRCLTYLDNNALLTTQELHYLRFLSRGM